MSSKATDTHGFQSLFAMQDFIATLAAANKSYRTLRVPHPKAGKPLYVVVIYG